VTQALRTGAKTVDEYLDVLALRNGGAVRASIGLATNLDDVERFLAFIEITYRDRAADRAGLAPRLRC
jgi:selenocysteine lyase/cysteine desulfurase